MGDVSLNSKALYIQKKTAFAEGKSGFFWAAWPAAGWENVLF